MVLTLLFVVLTSMDKHIGIKGLLHGLRTSADAFSLIGYAAVLVIVSVLQCLFVPAVAREVTDYALACIFHGEAAKHATRRAEVPSPSMLQALRFYMQANQGLMPWENENVRKTRLWGKTPPSATTWPSRFLCKPDVLAHVPTFFLLFGNFFRKPF